jgi:hypothetical protein
MCQGPAIPSRATSAETAQTIEQIATALEEFLAEHMRAVTLEDGKVLLNMRPKYKLATEHGRLGPAYARGD